MTQTQFYWSKIHIYKIRSVMYLELVGKPCKLKTIFLTVHICSFFSIKIILCLVKGGKLRYKELWGFRHAIDDFFVVIFCRRPFSALRINFVRLSCGFICNLFLYLVHKAICKQLTWNIGAQKFARSFSLTIFFTCSTL